MKLLYSYMRRLCAYITDRLYQFKRFLQLSIDGLGLSCPVFTKVTGILPVALVCFHFVCFAQESPAGREATGKGEIKPLMVGDTIPEELWKDSIVIYQGGKIVETTLESYRGKPLLIDFWATWCSTCIVNMAQIYSFEAYKKGELNIFPCTVESRKKINDFVTRKAVFNTLPFKTIVENNQLPKYFQHYAVPFYVLVNENGRVQAMVGLKEMEESLISHLIENKHSVFESELTNNTKNYPTLLASRYSQDLNYYYSFFYQGANEFFGSGNKKRSTDGKLYSLSMLNIPVKSILTTLARVKFQQDTIPFHYSFVSFDDLPIQHKHMLEEEATFEVAIPYRSKDDIIKYSLSELNRVLPFSVKFEDREVEMLVLYNQSKPIENLRLNDFVFSTSAMHLNMLFEEKYLFLEISRDNVELPALEKEITLDQLKRVLKSNNIGLRQQKINVPFLIIG